MLPIAAVLLVTLALGTPATAVAAEGAVRPADRELAERLVKLEEGQHRIEATLRTEIRANAEAIKQLREDMNAHFGPIDAQFDRMHTLMLGLLAAFTGLVASTIGFALWDRRTMVRLF